MLEVRECREVLRWLCSLETGAAADSTNKVGFTASALAAVSLTLFVLWLPKLEYNPKKLNRLRSAVDLLDKIATLTSAEFGTMLCVCR